MKAADYRQGGFLPILSFRMYALREHLSDERLTRSQLSGAARAGDRATFEATLGGVPAFGPRAAEYASALLAARDRYTRPSDRRRSETHGHPRGVEQASRFQARLCARVSASTRSSSEQTSARAAPAPAP